MTLQDPEVLRQMCEAVLEEAREVARRIDRRVGQVRDAEPAGERPSNRCNPDEALKAQAE
jgi:methylphosphotriester-DNA--protein-cysteine methyltransferase